MGNQAFAPYRRAVIELNKASASDRMMLSSTDVPMGR